MDNNAVGERIIKRRKSLGISQVILSQETGIPATNICKYEKGACLPSITTLVELASTLSCSIDWLLTGKEYVMTDSESAFLDMYRALNKESQNEMCDMMKVKLKYQKGENQAEKLSSSGDDYRIA